MYICYLDTLYIWYINNIMSSKICNKHKQGHREWWRKEKARKSFWRVNIWTGNRIKQRNELSEIWGRCSRQRKLHVQRPWGRIVLGAECATSLLCLLRCWHLLQMAAKAVISSSPTIGRHDSGWWMRGLALPCLFVNQWRKLTWEPSVGFFLILLVRIKSQAVSQSSATGEWT